MDKDQLTFLNQPHLAKAFWRLFLNPCTAWAESCPDEILRTIFAPPADHMEAILDHTADLLAFMVFNEETTLKLVADIISKSLPEIEEAYNVILRDGGGWSGPKGDPDKRQAAVLAWFDQHKARLSFLKRSYLEDPTLYNDGAGQEKRNFITRLLMFLLLEKMDRDKITFQKVHDQFNLFKRNGEWLRHLLALSK